MSRDLRVLLVIADSSRSGGPEHVLTLGRELVVAGWRPLVVCPEGELRERCRQEGIESAALAMDQGHWWGAPVRIRRLIRQFQADLVHSHGLRAAALVRRSRPEVAFVNTHHLDGWFTASPLRVAAHRREMQAVAKSAELEIAVSESVRSFLERQVGLDPQHLRLVYNGIRPLPARLREVGELRRVGVLAHLSHSKGVDIAILALTTPAGRRLRLRIGGAGPELPALVDLARTSGVASRVDFVGEVRDRSAFLDGCDVAWVPSLAEPFGLVALEAMSSGLPVVASRVGGLPEILEPPRFGLAVAPANPAALASVSQGLFGDPARYRELSEAGPERVGSTFSASQMGQGTLKVYWEALPATS